MTGRGVRRRIGAVSGVVALGIGGTVTAAGVAVAAPARTAVTATAVTVAATRAVVDYAT